MAREDASCTCVKRLDMVEMMSRYAEHIACDVVDETAGLCPAMIDLVTEQIVVRLIHVAVWARDQNLQNSDAKTLDAVENYLKKLSGTAPAALQIIIDNHKRKMGDKNASH
jgi:hypothetical protein